MGKKKEVNDGDKQPEIVTPGAPAARFTANFLKVEPCRNFILKSLHPKGAQCPACAAPVTTVTSLKNFWTGKRCACARCNVRFTALTGTQFQGSHLDYRETFLMAMLIEMQNEGLNIKLIAKSVNVSENTARRWIRKFKYTGGLKKYGEQEYEK